MTTPAWIGAKQRFKQYLQLERSLSVNSVEAYLADLEILNCGVNRKAGRARWT